MKKLKRGQIFNHRGLLWQVVAAPPGGCSQCDLAKYCIDQPSNNGMVYVCQKLCLQQPSFIPYDCTIRLVSKNENARRKIKEYETR